MTHRRLRRALAGLLALVPAIVSAGGPITVLTATQRREVATVSRAEGEMVAIEDVLAGLGAVLTSDPKGGAVTVQRGSHELVLHHKKSLASVDGDLKLLPAPAALEGGRWLVPVDGLARLLAPLLERPVEWRAAPRVLVIGPVSIPKISVSTFVSGELARVVFEASESVPFRVQQESGSRDGGRGARPGGRRAVSPRGSPGASWSPSSSSEGRRTCSRCSWARVSRS